MRNIVFIHGRAQQDHDPDQLKSNWIDAWETGLRKGGRSLDIPHDRIRFPYYGDTLRDLTQGRDGEDVADIIVRGAQEDDEVREMLAEILEEVRTAHRIGDDEIVREMERLGGAGDAEILERGPQNWRWVRAILRAVDSHVPGGGALVSLVTRDAYLYVTQRRLRERIEDGVLEAFDRNGENVVLAHSLGSIVAYTLFQRLQVDGAALRIPQLITIGSPLGIRAIRTRLERGRRPDWLGRWFNAFDPQDVVSLYPLDAKHFPDDPRIENKSDVDNRTSNQHGIAGYLADPVVAARLYEAATA